MRFNNRTTNRQSEPQSSRLGGDEWLEKVLQFVRLDPHDVVSDGTSKPYRVHMRAACLANLQLLQKMCEGKLIADVVAAIGSIDIVLGEIDR